MPPDLDTRIRLAAFAHAGKLDPEALGGRDIRLPQRPQDHPDPDRLALRYEQFRAAT